MSKKLPTVSLCMIVRDEEKNLETCIHAVKPFIDEIIIVDTGSKDRTVEIAKRNGAKIFNFVWKDNFSAARNFAIQQASCDWILNLDADHLLDCSNKSQLKQQFKETKHFAFIVDERSVSDSGNRQTIEKLLLFKNHCNFQFKGIIHETPLKSIVNYAKSKKIKMPIGKFETCTIDHIERQNHSAKLQRNLPILLNAVEKERDNFQYRFKLLLTLKSLGMFEEYNDMLLNTVYKIEQKKPALTESIVGIWGQFGDWVIKDSNADDIDKFYGTAKTINEKTKWNDIRLVWPYVKISIFHKKYDKAIEDLQKCIMNGIAPEHVGLSIEECITPVYQLIKLINDFKSGTDFIDIVCNLESLLEKSGLSVEKVLKTINKNDKVLFDSIMEISSEESLYDFSEILNSVENDVLISACMIIKDEEENLKRCLKSAKDIVDEIIVVDTGSTDKSIKVAESFNAKIIKHDWNDDFAEARNIALENATGDWILQLDADEELHPSTKKQIKNEMLNTAIDGVNVVIRNLQPKGEMVSYIDENQVRLFKNKPEYRFQNRINEQIVASIADTGGLFSESDIIINHYGFQSSSEERTKRNLSLLNNELKEHPQDPHLLFKLGETYKAMQKWDKAADCFTKALAQSSLTKEVKEIIYLRLGQISLARNEYTSAKKYAQGCLRFNSKNAMAKYILGVAMMYLKETKDALVLFAELKSTQKIHGLDLSDVDSLLDAMTFAEPEEVLN